MTNCEGVTNQAATSIRILMPETTSLTLAHDIAQRYAELPQVEAVALAGSQTTGVADDDSDIDLYVYVNADLPLAARAAVARAHAQRAEVDNQFWEPGDEWIDAATNIHVDVMFRTRAWIAEQLARVLRRHEAAVGYSTCFWYNVVTAQALFDREGWFQRLQEDARQPYPEALRRAIIAKNYPLLRQSLSSYRYQIERAVARNDWVSVNHRVAALLASYFDILFAVNRLLHPGEKRLAAFVETNCRLVPSGMRLQVHDLLGAIAFDQSLLQKLDALLDGLDELLRTEGLK